MQKTSKYKIDRIYAKALLGGAAQDDAVKEVYAQTSELLEILQKDGDITLYFSSPLISLEEKISTAKEICKKSELAPELCRLMEIVAQNDRFSELAGILQEFCDMYLKNNGFVSVEVQSVKELSKTQDKNLQKNLEELLSKKVIIKYQIKPEILGGLIIRYESDIIDDSIKGKLSRIETAMKGA